MLISFLSCSLGCVSGIFCFFDFGFSWVSGFGLVFWVDFDLLVLGFDFVVLTVWGGFTYWFCKLDDCELRILGCRYF